MTVDIHETALVDPKAELGKGVKIGPYSIIGPEVKLGDGVELISHVNLSGNTTIGEDCRLYPFVSMGYEPQDLKHKGGPVGIEIGPRCTFRENVNIHILLMKGRWATMLSSLTARKLAAMSP